MLKAVSTFSGVVSENLARKSCCTGCLCLQQNQQNLNAKILLSFSHVQAVIIKFTVDNDGIDYYNEDDD